MKSVKIEFWYYKVKLKRITLNLEFRVIKRRYVLKYSRSILIFLFISSTVTAFSYALYQTNGNVGNSIMFTMHYLLIKIGLIEPIILISYEPYHLDQPRVVVNRLLPCYTAEDGCYARPSRLYMGETKIGPIAPQYSHHASQMTELRAGSRAEDIKQTAYLLVSLWFAFKLQEAHGFQPAPNQMQRPDLEALNNFLFGKPKQDKYSSYNSCNGLPTQLNMGSSHAPEIDMYKEYQKFLLIKHPNTVCSQERFTSLCTDPQRSIITNSSIKEAIIILECEGRGLVHQVERPNLDKGEPNIDFRTQGPNGYTYVDVKEPRSGGRGNSNLDSAARRMGHKIQKQKSRVPEEKVLHIVNVELLEPDKRAGYQTNIFLPHGSEGIIIVDITQRN